MPKPMIYLHAPKTLPSHSQLVAVQPHGRRVSQVGTLTFPTGWSALCSTPAQTWEPSASCLQLSIGQPLVTFHSLTPTLVWPVNPQNGWCPFSQMWNAELPLDNFDPCPSTSMHFPGPIRKYSLVLLFFYAHEESGPWALIMWVLNEIKMKQVFIECLPCIRLQVSYCHFLILWASALAGVAQWIEHWPTNQLILWASQNPYAKRTIFLIL